jgi:adenylosuccinate synthase
MHKVFVDLGYGDAGKGITVARAVMNDPTAAVVKFAGGAQCAHNVVINGKHHTFSQFGSGALLGAPTLLADNFIIDVPAILREADHLSDLGLHHPTLWISNNCLVITAAMVAANKAMEDARGVSRHGSTGRGIGTTVAYDVETGQGVRAKDLLSGANLFEKINAQRLWLDRHHNIRLEYTALQESLDLYHMAYTWLNIKPQSFWLDMLSDKDYNLIFEGSQGVLLDENIGFFPNVTRATTTSRHATDILGDMGVDYRVYGIVRTYMTRHGAGPLPTELDSLRSLNDGDHNGTGIYQGAFRRGYLDIPALEYALMHQPIDGLVVTHSDITLPMAFGPAYEDYAFGDFADRMAATERLNDRVLSDYDLGDYTSPNRIARTLNVPLYQTGYGPEINDYMV